MKKIKLLLFVISAVFYVQAGTQYLIRKFPVAPVNQTDTVLIRWSSAVDPTLAPDSGIIFFSRTPGGSMVPNYSEQVTEFVGIPNVAAGVTVPQKQIKFIPKDQPKDVMNAGKFYCIVATVRDGDTLVSNEIAIIVKSPNAPTNLSPSLNTSESLDNMSPTFSWDNVPGVPYYHVILSDEPINIEETGVEGISIVWQAITPDISIKYGAPDPSGTITADPPPLSPGTDYNWLVLDNYGNHPAYTVAQVVKPAVFRISGDVIAKPVNLEPVLGASYDIADGDSTITFRWTKSSSNVNNYRVNIYVATDFSEDVGAQMIVWENSTTDTFVVMNAKSILTQNLYRWKVYAINDRGAGIASDTTSFRYSAPTGKMSVTTVEMIGDKKVPVSMVELKVDVVDGSLEKPLVFYTDLQGKLTRDRPEGTYIVSSVKKGYLVEKRTITVSEGKTESMEVVLKRPESTIFGKVVENISGTENYKGVNLVNIYGLSDRGDTITTQTDKNGYYVINSYDENWRVWAEKNGYVSSVPKDTIVNSSSSVQMPDIVIASNPNQLTGTITNENGVPIIGVNVKILRNGVVVDEVSATGEDGYYAFSLASGTYTVTANKVGFASVNKEVELLSSKRLDLTISSGAGVVKGYVVSKAWVATKGDYVYTPLPNASVYAIDTVKNDTISIQTNKTYGDFIFSLTGNRAYKIIASKTGCLSVGTEKIVYVTPGKTENINDTLLSLGYVTGSVKDTAGVNISDVTISLIDTFTNQIVASGKSYSDGKYEVRGVVDGNYRILAGKAGYTVKNGADRILVIKDGKNDTAYIVMEKAEKLVYWNVTDGASNKISDAMVKIKSPIVINKSVTDTISGVGKGEYIIAVDATDKDIIDLDYHSFKIDASDSLKLESIALPISHTSSDTLSMDIYDVITLTLNTKLDLDSIKLSYRDKNSPTYTDTIISGVTGQKIYKIELEPPKDGSVMYYYYTAYKGNDIYSNNKRPFNTYIPPSLNLKYAEITPDTNSGPMLFPKKYTATFTVHGYNGAYESLDSIINVDGVVAWSIKNNPSSVVLKKNKSKKNTVTITMKDDTTSTPVEVSAVVSYKGRTKNVGTSFMVTNNIITKIEVKRSDDMLKKYVTSSQSASFEAIAIDTNSGSKLTVTPNWTIWPLDAGTIDESGVFAPRKKFVGQVRIIADAGIVKSEYNKNAKEENSGLEVRYELQASAESDTIDDAESFKLIFPPNVVLSETPANISLKKPELTNIEKTWNKMEIAGEAYDITELNNASFKIGTDSIKLLLVVPPAVRDANNKIALWNKKIQEWEVLENSYSYDDSTLCVNLSHFSRYAVISEAQDLGISGLALTPNPFSPYMIDTKDGNTDYGLRIQFKPNSKMPNPEVRIRIYNMNGDLVRDVPVNSDRPNFRLVDKDINIVYWDGRTDSGKMARNGRYIVRITIDDGNKKEVIKPVVLIK